MIEERAAAHEPAGQSEFSTEPSGDDGRSHIRDVADGLSRAGKRFAENAADAARDAIAAIPDQATIARTGRRLALRGRQRLDIRTRRQPVEVLLFAGALGYLVGWATIRDRG